LGRELGRVLHQGDVIALEGELGSGKTWFAKGLALGLGVSHHTIVTSPSFSLVNEYEGRCTLFHMDVYRLENVSEFFAAGLDEYFYRDGVVVMEWANRWPEVLPKESVIVKISIIDGLSRKIELSGSDERALIIIQEIE
jgi:tRNA threonylcarbamoyladenosine biosynthesis protein TsaE